jgi:cytochrome c oxidase assembly protein subunit 15
VEFGNRLLTFVLVIIAAMVIVAIRKSKLGRRDLTILSYATLAGILIQVVLGGITVLTKLHPLTVAAHFLVSIGLISIAFALHRRAVETENVTKPKPSFELTVPPIFRQGAQLHTALALLVIVVGTIVTGSGPHAGDVNDVTRLPIDPRVISWLHADLVLLYIGLTLGLYVAAKSLKLNSVIVRAIVTVLVVSAVQGVIGYVQYFTGLPWVLVAFHITGSCLLWIATLNLLFTTRKLT